MKIFIFVIKDNKKQDINYTLFYYFGANKVVIYNFWALLTIDTNINQFMYNLSYYFLNFKCFSKFAFYVYLYYNKKRYRLSPVSFYPFSLISERDNL